jgi:hypothetical protein
MLTQSKATNKKGVGSDTLHNLLIIKNIFRSVMNARLTMSILYRFSGGNLLHLKFDLCLIIRLI